LYTAAFLDSFEKLLPAKLQREEFYNLAARHHNPQTPKEWIIAVADRLSSGLQRQEYEDYNREIDLKEYRQTRLLSFFEQINLQNTQQKVNYNYFYPLKKFNASSCFPIKNEFLTENPEIEYGELFYDFIADLENLPPYNDISIYNWFECFEYLFQLYTTNIPAATGGKFPPEVSLYDHCRTVAALTSALFLYHRKELKEINDQQKLIEQIKQEDEEKFLLIEGNLNGIQNFIFKDDSQTQKSRARLLRGRSFYASMLAELAAIWLCSEIGLPSTSILINSASKFLILAPNLQTFKEKISQIEKEINSWLIKYFYAETTFTIGSVTARASQFSKQNLTQLFITLANHNEEKKYSPFSLNDYGGVRKNYLESIDPNCKVCPFCEKRPADPNLRIDYKNCCPVCNDQHFIGRNLAHSKFLAIFTTSATNQIEGEKLALPIFDRFPLTFDVSGNLLKLARRQELIRYWNISDEPDSSKPILPHKMLTAYFPKENGELLTFEKMAESAEGIEALAAIKADIDNLGKIFQCGFQANNYEKFNLTKYVALSRMLNTFFTLIVPNILKKSDFGEEKEKQKIDKPSKIYTVFGGGDDLFLIGPWNQIIKFSQEMHQEFKRFVAENDQITLSCGIYLFKPNYPIRFVAEKVEAELNRAKNFTTASQKKNALTIFDITLNWQEFFKLINFKNEYNDSFINFLKKCNGQWVRFYHISLSLATNYSTCRKRAAGNSPGILFY